MIVSVTNKITGVEIIRYSAMLVTEASGYSFEDYNHLEILDTPVIDTRKYAGRRIITKLEFRGLFSYASLLNIDRFEVQFEASDFLTDTQKDQIRTSFNDYHAAEDVNLDDPRWIPGLGLYVALGMMTQNELDEVLNG